MPTPSRKELYDAAIKRMVTRVLEEQERQFAQEHASDTDKQLLAYLEEQAMLLGYSPRRKEIVGWRILEERFGDWETAVVRAGLPAPEKRYPVTKLPRIQEEIERQKDAYRQKKAEKKQRAQKRVNAQNEKRKTNKPL